MQMTYDPRTYIHLIQNVETATKVLNKPKFKKSMKSVILVFSADTPTY